jgi:hypothetical protein
MNTGTSVVRLSTTVLMSVYTGASGTCELAGFSSGTLFDDGVGVGRTACPGFVGSLITPVGVVSE